MPEEGWSWWAGGEQEWMTAGPCDSRSEVIEEAVSDGCGLYLDEDEDPPVWRHSLFIIEARQDHLRLAHWIPKNLLELAEDKIADSDRTSAEGDEGPFFGELSL